MERFNIEMVKDPHCFSKGCLPAHSDHVAYASEKEMNAGKTSFRYSLDGIWKLSYAMNPESAISGFEKESFDCNGWADVRVPAHIQMEGYDVPQYVNTQYPWDGSEDIEPGEIPEKFNPTASYVKYFTLPDDMSGRPVFISFQGAESGMALWLNGKFVGYAEDSFTPSDFDLTPYIHAGVNKLAVRVYKWTSGSWCEDQDFYRFSGLFRSVYIYTVPNVHIDDMKIETHLDDSYTNAELRIRCLSGFVKDAETGISDNASSAGISLSYHGKEIFSKKESLHEDSTFSYIIREPELWSAEIPNLYDLVIRVFNGKEELQEVIHQKVGFRRIEIKNHIMLLNGKRIVFNGVNRHDFSSLAGRAVCREDIVRDIITMKRNNINAVRTCHYPNVSMLYDLCDEYGLYMIAENNMETHGIWDEIARGTREIKDALPGDNKKWQDMLLDRVNSCYQRDKNHPAILIWSCGNESFGGSVIYNMSQKFRELDSTRLVHYEGIRADRRYEGSSDMESQMYTSVNDIKKFLSVHRDKPFICCEYAHAMGNSCGAVDKYTDLVYTDSLYQGGFIWDYIDQSITKKDRYGHEYQAYGGDFDERPNDGNFSGNGIVYGEDRTASPKMQAIKYVYSNIDVSFPEEGKVKIINHFLFTATDEFDCVEIIEKDGHKVAEHRLMTDVSPLSEKEYVLPEKIIPADDQAFVGEYTITISFRLKNATDWADAGHEIAFGQKVIEITDKKENVTDRWIRIACEKDSQMSRCAAVSDRVNLRVVRGSLNIGVSGRDFDVLFSTLNGGLISYRYGGREMLESMPMPDFWRAPTDNDRGNMMPQRYAQWKNASMYISAKDSEGHISEPLIQEKSCCVSVTFTYHMPTIPESSCDVSYTVREDGTIETKLSCDPPKELPDMPEFGIVFRMNADFDHIRWYGLGPAETYADRTQGAKLGIYDNLVKDNVAKYLIPQECGNKTGVRYALVTDARGRGMAFSGNQMDFAAMPYTAHELENAQHIFDLPQVHHTFVRCALAQMGVGGDDSWGARTHEEFLLPRGKKLEFSFCFRGV